MSALPYNAWVDEDKYMLEMARMHKLQPKLDVIDVLREEFDGLKADTNYKPGFIMERRSWLVASLSAQILALSLELTDDLAAVCLAYLETLDRRDTAFIEHLSTFTSKDGHRFYETVSKDVNEAAKAVGFDPESAPSHEIEIVRQKFVEIRDMRDLFWGWYIGYKHGQFATPIVLTFSAPGTEPKQEWGLYLIPRPFRRDAITGKLHTEDRFINTVDNVGAFHKTAVECVSLSIQTRDRQYPKIYGTWT
ncbi:MAG: hypothetical protein ABSF82_03420 [Candidatus Bathyarchaeia archaeon]|jgi:hypothetical protein